MSNRTYSLTEIRDDAVRNGLRRAASTVRNLDWFTISEIRGVVDEGGNPTHFQVTMKVGFRLEEPDDN